MEALLLLVYFRGRRYIVIRGHSQRHCQWQFPQKLSQRTHKWFGSLGEEASFTVSEALFYLRKDMIKKIGVDVKAMKPKTKRRTEFTTTGWFIYGWLIGFFTLAGLIFVSLILIFIVWNENFNKTWFLKKCPFFIKKGYFLKKGLRLAIRKKKWHTYGPISKRGIQVGVLEVNVLIFE
jgi:hypothetical protein